MRLLNPIKTFQNCTEGYKICIPNKLDTYNRKKFDILLQGDDKTDIALEQYIISDSQVSTENDLKPPSLYNVFLLNDHYTTMDFVVHVLQTIFNKTHLEATSIMLHVHKRGKGLAGTYIKEIALQKVHEVAVLAQKNGFPLKCEAQPQ